MVTDDLSEGYMAMAYSYGEKEFEGDAVSVKEALRAIGKRKVAWISVEGEFDDQLVELISHELGIDHKEMSSMIAHSRGKARMEDLGDMVFISWSLADGKDGERISRPAYFLLGHDFLISIQGGHVRNEEIVERLENERSRLRRSGPWLLLYSLLIKTAEEFFDLVEKLSDDMSTLEVSIIDSSRPGDLDEIRHMRDRINSLWKVIRHLRGASESLSSRHASVIHGEERGYFAELFSEFDLLLHEVDTMGQTVPQLIDLYENSTSQQLNQIVKVLTVFSVLFAPLSLLAAIFSMNFEYMPWRGHPHGYPLSLLLMSFVSVVMLAYFHRIGWLSAQKRD